MSEWLTIDCERALYVDRGREVILCDRLPSPVTLVVKLASAMSAGTAETQSGSGLQPASAVPEGQTPNPTPISRTPKGGEA